MKLEKRIEIEPVFNEFVKTFGGELVSEIVGKEPSFPNADYLFREDCVIAELKCLQKNFLTGAVYQKKIDKLYNSWIREGLISPMSRRTIDSRILPDKCQKDLQKIAKNYLETIVKKANLQIRETKARLNLPNAKGVLLLANDGNYSLETESVLILVTSIIRYQFTNVNYVAYFTVNMQAELRTLEGDIYVWAMAHGEKEKEYSYEFLHKLGDAWIEHVNKVTGIKHKVINAPKELVEHIKFVRES